MNETLNQAGIKHVERVIELLKKDIASYESDAASNYRDNQLAQLREQLVKREAKLAQLKGN